MKSKWQNSSCCQGTNKKILERIWKALFIWVVIWSLKLGQFEKSERGSLSTSRPTELHSQKDLWNHPANLLVLQPWKEPWCWVICWRSQSHLRAMPGTESRSSHSCWGSGHLKFQGIQGKGAEARDKSSGCERLNSGFVKFQIQLSYESKQGRRDSSSQVYVTQESWSKLVISMTTYWKRLVSLDHINPRSKHKNKRIWT